MRYIFYFMIFSVAISLLFSCGQDLNSKDEIQKQIKDQTGIIIPNYTLINMESSSATGDYSESFLLEFDSLEFQILISEILETKDYSDKIVVKTSNNVSEIPISGWKRYESGYKFETYLPNKNEYINYYVNTTKQTLYYMFIEE